MRGKKFENALYIFLVKHVGTEISPLNHYAPKLASKLASSYFCLDVSRNFLANYWKLT